MTQASTKPTLDARLVNPIVSATIEVLSTMANTQVKLKEVQPQKDYVPSGDISAVIGIMGDEGEGMVSLSFDMPLAILIVARLLGITPEDLSADDRCDGIGELVNMVSGNAKTALSQSGGVPYKLSLPTIVLGHKHEIISRPKAPYLVIVFETEEGHAFNLQVSFKPY
jgi:chemotaxis protein CheX